MQHMEETQSLLVGFFLKLTKHCISYKIISVGSKHWEEMGI